MSERLPFLDDRVDAFFGGLQQLRSGSGCINDARRRYNVAGFDLRVRNEAASNFLLSKDTNSLRTAATPRRPVPSWRIPGADCFAKVTRYRLAVLTRDGQEHTKSEL